MHFKYLILAARQQLQKYAPYYRENKEFPIYVGQISKDLSAK
jgi:hypothetical protein